MIESSIKNLLAKVDVQQLIKWVVYTLLIVNFGFYILEDWNRSGRPGSPGRSRPMEMPGESRRRKAR